MTLSRYALAAFVLLLLLASCKKDDDFVENKVPVAVAGASKAVSVADSAVLLGTGTDTDGKVVAYLWSQVSGPAASNIVNPGSNSTSVKFNVTGNYIFQLMVTDDKGATGVDTLMVTVNPSPIKTIVLQPSNNNAEIALVSLNGVDLSGYATISIEADAWTSNGNPYNIRSIFKFDLSSIPTSSSIKSAKLYLFSNPTPGTGNMVDANFGSSNTMLIQQVTSAWTFPGITFYNLPSLATSNQIVVAQAAQGRLDLIVDVTSMVGSMVNNNANYGFYMKLQNEVSLSSRIFVGSRNTTYPDKHPKLEVTYQ